MYYIEMITEFLGWCSVVNIAMLFLSSILLIVMRRWIIKIHAKLSGVSEADLPSIYLQFLGNYKLLILMFNLVPYIALRLSA
jgi:hypothetical protein